MSRIKRIVVLLFLLGFTGYAVKAQISPPGLGEANKAFWGAFGIRRKLDFLRKNRH